MTRPFLGLAFGICAFGAIATDAIDDGCFAVFAATVRPLDGGRYAVITDDGTFVIGPKGVHRSIDDHYWLCRFPNQAPRCLFLPFTGA